MSQPMPEVMETPPNELDITYEWASYADAACTLPIATLASHEDWPHIHELVNAHTEAYKNYPRERTTDINVEMYAVAAIEAAKRYADELRSYNERNGLAN